MTQGDLLISDNGKEVKKAADALRDVGQPVPEDTLVLNLFQGLNPRFLSSVEYIAGMILDFAGALDQIATKELRLANADKVAASTALIATTNPSCRSSTSSSAPPAAAQRPAAAPQEG
jgi:hypothetical protein